jgi:hypothetical protein
LLSVVFLIGLFALPVAPARAQTGTYVVPRVYTLWSGTLNNALNSTNIGAVLTNQLNYSGFHQIDLWATRLPAGPSTNNYMASSNDTISLDFSPGIANGYSNSVAGTNVVFTTTTPFTWVLPNTGTNLDVRSTNLQAFWVDGVAQVRVTKISSVTTNSYGELMQLDATITP